MPPTSVRATRPKTTETTRWNGTEERSQEERDPPLLTLGEGIEACPPAHTGGPTLADGVPGSTAAPCTLTNHHGPVPGILESLPNICLHLNFPVPCQSPPVWPASWSVRQTAQALLLGHAACALCHLGKAIIAKCPSPPLPFPQSIYGIP